MPAKTPLPGSCLSAPRSYHKEKEALGSAPISPVSCLGAGVLARLADAIGHRHLHRHILARKRGLHRAVVDTLDDEGHRLVGLSDLLLDLPLPPHRLRSHASCAVEPALLVDQRV